MTDYISRADAMAEFREWVKRANENGETPTWNDAVSLIGSLPSADAVQGGDAKMDNCQAPAPQNYMQHSRHDDGRMTREEAIQVLQDKVDNSPLFKDEREAFDMAIEALTVAVSREDTVTTVTLNSPISIQAEMVMVVRCKDCKHGEEDYPQRIREQMDERWKDTPQTYSCKHSTYSHDGEFFCGYGERREE